MTGAGGSDPLVFGVPGPALVGALRGAGLTDANIVAIMGRAVAASAGVTTERDTAAAGFVFTTQIAETAPECALSYARTFVHPDFIDGVTVVQGGATPDEIGFNARFHSIEGEFDSVARNLQTASNCIAELRRELFGLTQELQAKITEIDERLTAKGGKETKETKEKDTKEGKDGKDTKEKETKEGKDKEGKDTKEGKEGKERKEKDKEKDKDHIDKLRPVEKIQTREKLPEMVSHGGAGGDPEPEPFEATVEPEPGGDERTFIRLEDRPAVGEDALREPDETAEPEGSGQPEEPGDRP